MAVAIIRTADPAGVNAASNVATYSTVSIGVAAPNRIVVVLVATELAASTPSGCTIDYGSGDTAMTAGTGGNFGAVYAQTYRLLVTTGTTATIKVTYSSTNPTSTQNHISVYTVTGAVYASNGGNGSTDMDATTPLTTGSITIGTDGGFIAVAAGATDTVAKTWANATEDLDKDAGAFRYTTATRTTALTTTAVTCQGTTNGEDGAMSWLIFTNNSSPTTALSSPADAGSTSDTTPDLTFTGTDANSDDVRYRVQVDGVNTFPVTYGNGLSFNGSSQYAEKSAAGSNVTDNFTMACWIKITAYSAGNAAFFHNGANDARGQQLQYTNAGVFQADYAFVANISSGYTLSTGTWYHVGLIKRNGVTQLYVNGAPQGSTSTASPNSGTDWITLGSSQNNAGTNDTFANCVLDDVRFYERAITPAEMLQLYNNGNDWPYTDISSTNLFYWYKLDESSGNPQDSSGSAKHLTATGSPTYTTGIVATGSSIDIDKVSGTDAGFSGSPDNTDPFTSGQAVTYTVQSALTAGNTYYWRVRSIDPAGSNVYGAWSSTRSFTVTAAGAATPAPNWPTLTGSHFFGPRFS